jgi:hypothetical protein
LAKELAFAKLLRQEKLYLQHNFLKELPDNINQLVKLKILLLHDNKLTKLPSTLPLLPSLVVRESVEPWGRDSLLFVSLFLLTVDLTGSELERQPPPARGTHSGGKVHEEGLHSGPAFRLH